jgi:hypothetical protein
MTNTFIFGSKPETITWNITLGQSSSFSVEFFKEDTFTPVDLSTWAIRGGIYNPDDHMMFNLDFVIEGNIITLYVPEQDTAIMNRPENLKNKIIDFDIQGFSPDYNFETDNPIDTFFEILGKVSVTDPNQ